MSKMDASTETTLRLLLKNPGQSLAEIARGTQTTAPATLRRLRNLMDEGLLRAERAGPGNRVKAYYAIPYFSAAWVEPAQGILTSWSVSGPLDWRFPLVSRVPDPASRAFLHDLLDHASGRGLLPPFVTREAPSIARLCMAVFGSCARDVAPPKSDLDLLFVGNSSNARKLFELAHEVALDHPRQLSARLQQPADLHSLPETFRREIAADAKTVWSNDPARFLIESLVQVPDG